MLAAGVRQKVQSNKKKKMVRREKEKVGKVGDLGFGKLGNLCNDKYVWMTKDIKVDYTFIQNGLGWGNKAPYPLWVLKNYPNPTHSPLVLSPKSIPLGVCWGWLPKMPTPMPFLFIKGWPDKVCTWNLLYELKLLNIYCTYHLIISCLLQLQKFTCDESLYQGWTQFNHFSAYIWDTTTKNHKGETKHIQSFISRHPCPIKQEGKLLISLGIFHKNSFWLLSCTYQVITVK